MQIDMPDGQWIDVEDVDWDWHHDEIVVVDSNGHRMRLSTLPHPTYMRSALEGYGFVDSDAPWPGEPLFKTVAA